jgi:glycosyltransferase involved in cell wall biosynthesis
MTSLRILHVVPYYQHAWAYGGIPRVATTLTQGLARRGHHVTVFTTDACDERSRSNAPHTADRLRGSLDVQVFPNLSNRLAYHWQFFMPSGLSAKLRESAGSFDVGHIHACHNLPAAQAARALLRAGVRYVLSPHGTAPAFERRVLAKQIFTRTAGRHVLPGAARVLAVSDAERRQLLRLGIPPHRIAVVSNPIEDREYDPKPDGASFRSTHGLRESPIILFLGKLTPRKGVDVLLRAFATLRWTQARLVIAGNDMASGALDTLLEPSIAARVQRVGLLRGRDRLDALAAADVVVYPSRDEVFGLVPVEALMCGSPVIVSNDSGCGEIIGTIGGGHIVPYGDANELAGAIDSILDLPDLWRRRARAAADRARVRFGTDVVCEELEAVYLEAIGARGEEGRRSA